LELQLHVAWAEHSVVVKISDAESVDQPPPWHQRGDDAVQLGKVHGQLAANGSFAHEFDRCPEKVHGCDPMAERCCGTGGGSGFRIKQCCAVELLDNAADGWVLSHGGKAA